jgi:predicted nucleotidyltransferase
MATKSRFWPICYNPIMGLAERISSVHTIEQFCQRHHIRKLAFFGSVVRDDYNPQSDIDVLVEFEPDFTPGLDFFLIEAELSNILGRKVDLQTASFLSPEILRSALSEAITAYEQT